MKKFFNKIICLFIVIGLNCVGLFAIGQTVAYFNDTEISKNNTFEATRLDFALLIKKNFEPNISPLQNSVRTIKVQDYSTMNYNYRVRVGNSAGGLCDYLFLTDGSGELQPLNSFVSNYVLYSEKQEWNFTASLNTQILDWQGKICQFDFIYEGWQEDIEYGGGGFSDTEIINNFITSVEPEIPICMKINEVYYDPGVYVAENDPKDEWIELYNNCDYEVNLKGWYLHDNNSIEYLNHNYIILPHQFVVIAVNASTWAYWPDIPDNAFKIALGGTKMFNGLSNDGDVVFLYDNLGNRIDEVSWGNDITGLNPSVPDVSKGHSISRKEKGIDTNTNADWMDTYSGSTPAGPNPGTNLYAPDGSLLLPAIIQGLSTQGLSVEGVGETSAPIDDRVSETELQDDIKEDPIKEDSIKEDSIKEDSIKEENEKPESEIIDESVDDVYKIELI